MRQKEEKFKIVAYTYSLTLQKLREWIPRQKVVLGNSFFIDPNTPEVAVKTSHHFSDAKFDSDL